MNTSYTIKKDPENTYGPWNTLLPRNRNIAWNISNYSTISLNCMDRFCFFYSCIILSVRPEKRQSEWTMPPSIPWCDNTPPPPLHTLIWIMWTNILSKTIYFILLGYEKDNYPAFRNNKPFMPPPAPLYRPHLSPIPHVSIPLSKSRRLLGFYWSRGFNYCPALYYTR